MALNNNYSKFGTRMSLSERFALIRKEAQKRAISVNPVVDPPSQIANRNLKNFNGTVSRADRPSAILQQGSDRNKRLVLQMARAPAVMAELNPTYNAVYHPQILAQLPQLSQTPQLMRAPQLRNQLQPQHLPMQPQHQLKLKPQQQNIRQRLGNGRIQSVKSRLGVKRVPINQRIGSRPIQSDLQNNRNINNKLRPRNPIAFKKKVPLVKFNQPKPIKKFPKTPLNGRQPLIRQASQPARKPVTVEQLDQDLDVYMQNSKGYLNVELDAYMSQA